ncbi:hypothetical protein, partial [Rhodococcus jostii]
MTTTIGVSILAAAALGQGVAGADPMTSGTPQASTVVESSTTAPVASPAGTLPTVTAATYAEWTLYNDTGQDIYGFWFEQVGDQKSKVERGKEAPLLPGHSDSQPQHNDDSFYAMFHRAYYQGHFCFDHKQWNVPYARRDVEMNENFRLFRGPDDGRLYVSYHHG